MDKCLFKVLIVLIFFSFNVHSTSREIIVLGTTNAIDTPLYQKAERILIHAFDQLNYDLLIEVLPSKRSLKWANSGRLDGELFRVSDLDLMTLSNLQKVEEPLFIIDQSVIGKKNIKVDGWKSMSKYVVAYERGTMFIEKNKDNFKSVILVNSFNQAASLIQSGRADITITSKDTADMFLASIKNNKEPLIVHKPPLVEIALHVYINKVNYPYLAEKLSSLLALMKRNGKFDALITN
ncbi:MAG: ABC transporter substrate-binding protein [Colwellia sp.]|nr:ABC transporter substrate-binding protein [Colwellia sp.]